MTTTPSTAHLDIDPSTWRAHAPTAGFRFRHDLAGDPRLSHDALGALAGRLPAELVEVYPIDLPDVFDSDAEGHLEGDGAELVRNLASLRRWAGLHNVERDAVYGALVEECLAPFAVAVVGGFEGGMTEREGYVFLAPPGSTTPAHLDHEHNFLLQVRGEKEVTIGRVAPEVEHRTLEGMHGGHYGRSPVLPDNPAVFRLGPGDGLYIPPRLVHLVHTVGEDLSISLSLVFHTPVLDRHARVYAANHDLRRIGLSPRPPGGSAARDALKSTAVSAWRRAKRAATTRRA